MDIIKELERMQEKLSSLPPCPKRIEATKELYYILERECYKIYDKSEYKGAGILGCFQGIQLWLQDDFSEWTEEEKAKGFKVIY